MCVCVCGGGGGGGGGEGGEGKGGEKGGSVQLSKTNINYRTLWTCI